VIFVRVLPAPGLALKGFGADGWITVLTEIDDRRTI